MKRLWTIMSVAVTCLALIASCAKEPAGDDNAQAPEPEPVEVSLEAAASTPESFDLTQDEDGNVSGTVEFTFTANLSAASSEDVTVSFAAECDGISADKISLSKESVVIKAGKTVSEEITVKVTDWSELASVAEAKDYTLTVSIDETSAEVSSSESEISVTVKKPVRPDAVVVSLVKSEGTPESFDLTQDEDGNVSGTVEFSFTANLSSAPTKDVTVSFAASCEGISAEKISLSKESVVIKAGETVSEEVTVKVTDWSELASVAEAKDYTLTVSIYETSAEASSSESEVSVVVKKPVRPDAVVVSLVKSEGTPESFDLTQDEDGNVSGTVEFSFMANLSAASTKDVTVSFAASCEGISAEKISLSKESVVIKAGETVSEEVTVKVTDWSELSTVTEAKDYTLIVSISETSAEASSSEASVSVLVKKPEMPVSADVAVSLSLTSDSQSSFELSHGKDGVSGNVSFSFTAGLSSAASEDVVLTFNAACPGISSDKIVLTPSSVTIPAGSTVSEPVAVSVTDWSELNSVTEAGIYTLSVNIDTFTGADIKGAGVQVTVNKPAFVSKPDIELNYYYAPSGTANSNVTEWDFTFWSTNGTALENPEYNTVNGKGSSDVAVNDDLINFTVDFKETKSLSGIYLLHWGSAYRAESFRLSYSNDGNEWTELGTLDVVMQEYYVYFNVDVNARYLKYEMLEATPRVDIVAFKIYEK